MITEIRKQLECLYSWAEFYGKNQQWEPLDKCELQIQEFKQLNNLQ